MLQLTDLVKRQEYKYLDEINFDSLYNQDKLNYLVNKYFVFENINEAKLLEQIKLHAVDFKYKTIEKLYFVFVSFHSLYDFKNFNSVSVHLNDYQHSFEDSFIKSFDVKDSKNIKYIL